jgi:drug/metabolite transporter (DMT)-like permease
LNLPILSLIIANLIWGAASPIFKWSLEGIQPFTLAFFRFYIASVVLLIILRKKVFQVKKKNFWKIVLIAFCGITVNISFFFWGLQLSKSINAPVIASTQPLIIFLFAIFFLREKIKLNKLMGLIMGFSGVILIIIQPIIDRGGLSIESLGDLFLVVAALGAVGHTILSKKLMNDHAEIDPFVLTFWMFIIGTVSFLPMFIMEILNPKFNPASLLQLKPMVGIVFGSLFSSLAGYALFAYGLSKIKAQEAGIFTYIDPVAAIVIAIPLLHETITWEFILGSILIFGGIFLAEHRIHYHPIHKLFKKILTNTN